MKRLATGIAASLVVLCLTSSAQKDGAFSGEISDRYCAKANSHEVMLKRHNVQTVEDCIPACVKAGGKYVLFDTIHKTVYELDDAQKAVPFARQKVKITGTLDKATQTIHITNIEREQ